MARRFKNPKNPHKGCGCNGETLKDKPQQIPVELPEPVKVPAKKPAQVPAEVEYA